MFTVYFLPRGGIFKTPPKTPGFYKQKSPVSGFAISTNFQFLKDFSFNSFLPQIGFESRS